MSTVLLILLFVALHVGAAALLIRHLRRQRMHLYGPLPVIGSNPALTDALHQSLCRKRPGTDWLNPVTMRAKLAAWRSQAQAAEQQARHS